MCRQRSPVLDAWRVVAVWLAVVVFALPAAAAPPQISEVRLGVHASKTRVVLDISAPVTFRAFTLPNPYRVVVDMPEVTWSPELRRPPKGGLVSSMRFGLFKPGVSRVVVDTAGPVKVAKSFTLPPSAPGRRHRLVIDIAPTTREAFMRSYRSKPVVRHRPQPRRPVIPPKLVKPVRPAANDKMLVMIDPGHGGIDPGAISPRGTWEKHIVLAHAKELRRQLRRTGRYRVRMTRERDVFIRLRDRIAIARKAGADLFVSLHADSIASPRVRGASVYTLSERASDKEAAALAAKENKSDLIAGVDLNERPDEVVNILIDLAQRETMNESAVFAKILVGELGKTRKMLRNTHRFAGFAVLKAPDIPSVLVELGYLSNRYDERLLRNPAKRTQMVSSIVLAVDKYFLRQQALNRP